MKEGDQVRAKTNSRLVAEKRIPREAVGVVRSAYQEIIHDSVREIGRCAFVVNVDFGDYGRVWGELAGQFEHAFN